MFCKWCGKKITNNGIPCPSCGRNQDALESGNGFWDLCSVKPVDASGVPKTNDVPVQEKKVVTSKTPKKEGAQKTAARVSLLQIAIICLLLITLTAVSIDISKTNDCLRELNTVCHSISDLNKVHNGVEKGMEYQAASSNPDDTQASEDLEVLGEDENNELSIDALLESNAVLLVRTNQLSIESYETEFDPACTVHIASGDLLAEDNIKIYWQKSTDAGGTWQTLAEDSVYLVEDRCDNARYRVLCLMDANTNARYICCYAVTTEFVADNETHKDETPPVPDTEETGTTQEDETVQGATEEKPDASTPRQQ